VEGKPVGLRSAHPLEEPFNCAHTVESVQAVQLFAVGMAPGVDVPDSWPAIVFRNS